MQRNRLEPQPKHGVTLFSGVRGYASGSGMPPQHGYKDSYTLCLGVITYVTVVRQDGYTGTMEARAFTKQTTGTAELS